MADTARSGLRAYWRDSRDLFNSLVVVLPLFVLYQLGVLFTGGLTNGVDFVTSALFVLFDGSLTAYLVFNLAVLAAFGVALALMRGKGTFSVRVLPWMLLESTVYALLFGSAVIWLIHTVGLGAVLRVDGSAGVPLAAGARQLGLIDKLVMSAGAGLYEELVFRLLFMGGLFALLHRVIGVGRVAAAIVAVAVSSVIFSAVHHISEPFTMSAFTFRVFAGALFALIFHLRGLAIAAYTHAIYDVWVMVFHER